MSTKKISELDTLSLPDGNDFLLVLQRSNDGLNTYATYKTAISTFLNITENQDVIASVARLAVGAGNAGLSYNSTTGEFIVDFNVVASREFVNNAIQSKDNTDEISEGTSNLYFSNARARSAISVSGSLSYNSATGVISYTAPTLAAVATSGSYNDLTNKPTIPAEFTLPVATTSTLGGVKIDGTTITINGSGVISATADTNTTYSISAETATGGVNLRLTGSDASIDNVKFAAGSNIALTRTDANTITVAAAASGSTTQVQYNSSGTLAGSANLTFNGTTLSVSNTVSTTTLTATTLNIQDINFTGTGAVVINSNNDLNLTAVGAVQANGEKIFTLTALKSVVAASSDFNDFKTRVAGLT